MKLKITLLLLLPFFTFSQVNFPTAPQPTQMQQYGNKCLVNPNNINVVPNPMQIINITDDKKRQQLQNQQLIQEVEQYEKQRIEASNQLKKDVNSETDGINYNLPSLSNIKGTEYYRNVYDKMLTLNVENYSVKDLNFQIENAFFENKQDKADFDKIIKQTAEFLTTKMQELQYDPNSNSAKNFMLFQFFSETLQLKSNGLKHLPFKYDFEDYMGVKDYSKMFVSKLIAKHSGQCHSMPLLYLILAEQIGAEAFLSFSPNHSFIKFRDENNKWYNVELTGGMFMVSSFVLNSGFIKAEAMQNHIYMQNLSKKELLSQFYSDLANGYIHKFGYDEFVEKVADKSLELYPNNIHAQMIKSNFSAKRFEFVANQVGINPRNKEDLQKINKYPNILALLQEANYQSQTLDNLGFEEMPPEAYQNWLNSLKGEKNKQDDATFKKQFKGLIIKKTKD